MRRLRLISAVAGLLLAVCVPARAESARQADPDSKTKAAASKDCAARQQARAAETGKTAPAALDTLVVEASGPDRPGFTMVGENVTYHDPSFVPYKMREAARRARATADISKIP
jgi:hypothetical protein